MNSTNQQLVNAWIYMGEKDPVINGKVIGYNDPASSYQALIKNNVYKSVDILFIAFVTTTPVADGGFYTIRVSEKVDEHSHHPDGLTNEDYMNFVIRDSRKNNPNIKIAVTLDWGEDDLLTRIFSNGSVTDKENAEHFAINLLAWLKSKSLDGFDIDWERMVSDVTTQPQFKLLIDAIGALFQQQTDKHYYLTLSPSEVGNLDADATNNYVDFLNLQLYYDSGLAAEMTTAGVKQELLAYGVSFESGTRAADAYKGYKDGNYKIITNWRLNSSNFNFEQANQQQLYQLVKQ